MAQREEGNRVKVLKRILVLGILLFLVIYMLSVTCVTAAKIDFTGIRSPSTSHLARYDVDEATKETDPAVGTEFSTDMYDAISISDDIYAVSRVIHAYDYSQQIFRFRVSGILIKNFTMTWEGNIAFLLSGAPHIHGIQIWNRISADWEWAGNVTKVGEMQYASDQPPIGESIQNKATWMVNDETVSKTYVSNIDNYIDSGYITLMVWGKNSHDATICTDCVKLDYATEYYLAVKTNPPSIATIPGENWYNECANVTLTAVATVQISMDAQYKFTHWDVDSISQGAGINPITVHMNANRTATANYIIQYYLTIASSQGTPVGEAWYNKGETAYASITPLIVPGAAGVQYCFTHWSGDASGTASQSNSISMDGPKIAVANWKIQYYLAVNSDPADLSPLPTPSSGWFDGSANIVLSAPDSSYFGDNEYVFDYWKVDGRIVSDRLMSLHMNASYTAIAYYKSPYVGGHAILIQTVEEPPFQIIPLSALLVGTAMLIIFLMRRGSEASEVSKTR